MTDPKHWLLDWFKEKGPVPGDTIEEQLSVNYYEERLIDSLGVINLIFEIEEHFGIQFSQDHFQERRFATIEGLASVISELCAKDKQEGNNM